MLIYISAGEGLKVYHYANQGVKRIGSVYAMQYGIQWNIINQRSYSAMLFRKNYGVWAWFFHVHDMTAGE